MRTKEEDVAGTIGAVPSCDYCGSERVVKDAWACWNSEFGLWELESVFDQEFCQSCELTCSFVWTRQEIPPNKRIRELNDRFRKTGMGHGSVVLTIGVRALGREFSSSVIDAVRSFDGFSEANDPWGEHDFGAFELDSRSLYWKIDYYSDSYLKTGSENPANEHLTHRVLTIMLASEY